MCRAVWSAFFEMPISDGDARRSKFPVCRGSQALATNRVYIGSVILIHGLAGGGETMSRHFAACFAIVGTLAFASGGAASAAQVNIPHINIPRPQVNIPHINIPRPQISVPTPHPSISKVITTARPPRMSVQSVNKIGLVGKVDVHVGGAFLYSPSRRIVPTFIPGIGDVPVDGAFTYSPSPRIVPTVTPGNGTVTISGSTLANPVSSTGGAYPTVETSSLRCRSNVGVSNCR
jgi:hypothetical protein